MATDPEAQGWSVSMAFKGKVDHDLTVAGYRKSLVKQLVSQMLNLRLREIARRPNAPFLGAQAGSSGIGRTLELFEIEASVPEGQITEGLGALMVEAKRMQQYGFSNDELNRAKAALIAGYERAYKERATAESPGLANEYVRHFLEQEPIPGIEFEYKIASAYVPSVTAEEVSALAKTLITDENRVVLAVAPEKKGVPPPSADTLRSAIARAAAAPVERWADATSGRALVEKPPAAGKVTSTAHGSRGWRHGAHAVERRRSVAETDRLQERSNPLQRLCARRRVAGQPGRIQERGPRRPPWSGSAAWAGSARSTSARCCRARSRRRQPRLVNTRRT